MMMFYKPILVAMVFITSTIVGGQDEARPAAVEMQYCGMRPGKPPLLYMAFNVTVRNFADKPQWFLFPAALYDKAVGVRSNAGIDAIELFSDSPEHKVTVVSFMGTMNLQPEGAGGFKGLLLPAGAVVSVHGLDIEFWGDPVSPISMRVVIADQVTLGGVQVEEWFGKTLASAKTADVKDLAHAGSKMAEGLKELPAEITKSGEVTVADALSTSCPETHRK